MKYVGIIEGMNQMMDKCQKYITKYQKDFGKIIDPDNKDYMDISKFEDNM